MGVRPDPIMPVPPSVLVHTRKGGGHHGFGDKHTGPTAKIHFVGVGAL